MTWLKFLPVALSFVPEKCEKIYKYFTYCAAVIESEVDILTGESQIRRVDIMADFGER